MFSHLLVAWDGSPNARRAFDYGLEIASRFGSRLHIVSVAHGAEHAETERERDASRHNAQAIYEKSSEELLSSARKRDVLADFLVVMGTHPAEDIVTEINRSGIDLAIVGRRGKSPVERFLMGSVSDRIAHYAPCPVLIIGEA